MQDVTDPRARTHGDATRPTERAATAETAATAERVRLAATRLARRLRQEAGSGLTPSQLAAMATIERHGPLPVGALADEEGISPSTATKLVDKLVGADLAERHADPEDRRVAQVTLTGEGRRALATIRARKTAWLARRLDELPADDLDRLLDAVEILECLTAPPTSVERSDDELTEVGS